MLLSSLARNVPIDEYAPLIARRHVHTFLGALVAASMTKHNASGDGKDACSRLYLQFPPKCVCVWWDEARFDGDNGLSCSNVDVTHQIRLHDLDA